MMTPASSHILSPQLAAERLANTAANHFPVGRQVTLPLSSLKPVQLPGEPVIVISR